MFTKAKDLVVVVGALTALALGGSAIAGAAGSGTTSTTSTTSASSATSSGPPRGTFDGPAHGTVAHEDAETPVTGEAATKAQEAAVKSVGSGKAGAVTTDYTKTGYEVTVTKSDGSSVEVHLDSSFNAQGPGR